jgi:hypothetical protein
MTSCSDIFQIVYSFNENLLENILPSINNYIYLKNFLIGFFIFIELPLLLLAVPALSVWNFISNVFCANHEGEVLRPSVCSSTTKQVSTDNSDKKELPEFPVPSFLN